MNTKLLINPVLTMIFQKLVDPANGLMDYNSSSTRIREWQNRIKDYISNDTGEDMEIKDETAPAVDY